MGKRYLFRSDLEEELRRLGEQEYEGPSFLPVVLVFSLLLWVVFFIFLKAIFL